MKSKQWRRRGFTLLEALAVTAIVLLLVALLLPYLQTSRGPHHRGYCMNNMKQILLSLHNYHDVYRQWPNLTSTQLRGVAPGSLSDGGREGAGYSWLVKILPYLEETTLYRSIGDASEQFTTPPFDPALKQQLAGAGSGSGSPLPPHSAAGISNFRCPKFSGSEFALAPEYQAFGKDAVAGCNYVALAATHLDCVLGDPQSAGYVPPNGVLIPGPGKTTFTSIVDGLSRTLMLVETREEHYTSWYDGTVGWVVGANPNGPPPEFSKTGELVAFRGATALNVGPEPDANVSYLPARLHGAIQQDWQWGPSSEHDGVVIHGAADGAVRAIADNIDPLTYLQLITRDGRETVDMPE